MTAEELAKALDGKRSGDGWAAQCPAHDDAHASLSIGAGDNGVPLFHCHAGCTQAAVIQALKDRGLWPPKPGNNGKPKRIVAVYPYCDETGRLLYESVRYDPKDFRQRRPDGNGGYVWNLKGVKRVLYRLPELLNADPTQRVYVVEGEKDADRLATLGLIATTNAGGAGKWHTVKDVSALHGRRVVILSDNDRPGIDHAEAIAESLAGKAANVKVVALPGLPDKGDVSDFLDAGHPVDELHALADAAPEWEPDQKTLRFIPGSVDAGAADKPSSKSDRGPTQATLLVKLAAGAELFHDPAGDPYATFIVGDHRETWPTNSKGFRRWLQGQFYCEYDKAPGGQSLADALGVIEAKASFDGPEHTVHVRVAGDDKRIYPPVA